MATKSVAISVVELVGEIKAVLATGPSSNFRLEILRSLKEELKKRGIDACNGDIERALNLLVERGELAFLHFISDTEESVCPVFGIKP